MQRAAPYPPGCGSVVVRNKHPGLAVVTPYRRLGEQISAAGSRDDLLLVSSMRCRAGDLLPGSSRILPSLPPCASKPPPSSTGEVEPTSRSLSLSSSLSSGV